MKPHELERILKQEGYSIAPGSATIMIEPEKVQPVDPQRWEAFPVPAGPSQWADEWRFQFACIQEAERLEHEFSDLALLHAVPNGAVRTGKGYGRVDAGVKAGIPDLMLPVARLGYFGLYIELKIFGGRVRNNQRQWINDLIDQGYEARVIVESVEAFSTLLQNYMKGPKTLWGKT